MNRRNVSQTRENTEIPSFEMIDTINMTQLRLYIAYRTECIVSYDLIITKKNIVIVAWRLGF